MDAPLACPTCRKRPHERTCGTKVFAKAHCPCCLETCEPVVALPCGHAVCETCFARLGALLIDEAADPAPALPPPTPPRRFRYDGGQPGQVVAWECAQCDQLNELDTHSCVRCNNLREIVGIDVRDDSDDDEPDSSDDSSDDDEDDPSLPVDARILQAQRRLRRRHLERSSFLMDLDSQLVAARHSQLDTYDTAAPAAERLQRIMAQVTDCDEHIQELASLINVPDPAAAPGNPTAAALVRAAEALIEGRAACYAAVQTNFVASAPAGAEGDQGLRDMLRDALVNEEAFDARDMIEGMLGRLERTMDVDEEPPSRRRRRADADGTAAPPARRRRTERRSPSPSPSPSPPRRPVRLSRGAQRRARVALVPQAGSAARMGASSPSPSPSPSPERPARRRAPRRAATFEPAPSPSPERRPARRRAQRQEPPAPRPRRSRREAAPAPERPEAYRNAMSGFPGMEAPRPRRARREAAPAPARSGQARGSRPRRQRRQAP